MYCEHCCISFDEGYRCPKCGGRHVREVRDDDVFFVAEVSSLWGGVLADLLLQEKIPFLTRSALGAALAMQLGSGLEYIRFYVSHDNLSRAKEIAENLLTPVPLADAEEIDAQTETEDNITMDGGSNNG